MFGDQAKHLVDGRRDGTRGNLGQAFARLDGVGRLDPDDQRRLRKHAQAKGHHQRPGGSGEVRIGELVAAFADAEARHVEHLRSLHHDTAGRSPEVNGIDDQQDVDIAGQQLLHQTHAADADLQHSGASRKRLGGESFRYDDTDTVVGA